MRSIEAVASLSPQEAWALTEAGDLEILDLRTTAERKRYGWPPGARHVSLSAQVARPKDGGEGVAYLCQHANRSKLTGRKGAPEIAGGFKAWLASGLPVER